MRSEVDQHPLVFVNDFKLQFLPSFLLVISITFYFFSWYLYKPESQEERELGASLNVAEAIDPGRETNL